MFHRERPPKTLTVQAKSLEASVGFGGMEELRFLSEGSTYEAWVAAHSGAGEGEPSAPQPASTASRGISMINYNYNILFTLYGVVVFLLM